MIPDDPTNHERPMRRQSYTEAPITEPAERGFFHARASLPSVAVQWAFALLLVWLVLSACTGPDDVHAAADVQADIDAIAQALEGERPSYISEQDWIAAKHALLAAQGKPMNTNHQVSP